MTGFRSWAGSILCLAAFCFIQPAAAQELPPGIKFIRSLGGISEYQLDNGLQLLLMPSTAAPQTRVSVTYRVGSRHEGPGEAGMAHLLEHVTFRGTTRFVDLGGDLQRLFVSFNGTTSDDRTNYIDSFAANEATLREVLALEASRMHEALLTAEGFAKEKPIVLNEMALRAGSVSAQMQQALAAAAFRVHPYGRPVIGFAADIENLSLPTLRSFYQQHYRPDNATLMIAGAFDPARTLAAVSSSFGLLARPATALKRSDATAEPVQPHPRLMTIPSAETALAVGYRVPGMAHPDAAALVLLRTILGRRGSSFTNQVSRPYRQNPLGALTTRDPFLIGVILELPSDTSNDARSRRDLEQPESEWLLNLETTDRATWNEEYIGQLAEFTAKRMRLALNDPAEAPEMIANAVGAGDWRLAFKLLDGISQLDGRQIYDVANRYLRAENRTLVRGVTDARVTAPVFEEQPLSGLASWLSRKVEVGAVKDPSGGMDAFKAAPTTTAAEPAFDRTPAALDKASRLLRLPSGVLLALIQKPSVDERVTVSIKLRWGKAADMARQPQAWRVLGAMLEEGTTSRSADQIQFIMSRAKAGYSVDSGPQGVTAWLTAPKSTLLPALVLFEDMLAAPNLPRAAFEVKQDRMLAQLATAARRPEQATLEALRRHQMQGLGLVAGDAGYVHSVDELTALWKALSVEDVRQFHRQFWSANEARIAVVGPSPDGLVSIVEQFFGPWRKPMTPAFERAAPVFRPMAAARFVAAVSSAAQPVERRSAQVLLYQNLALNRQSADYFPALIGVRILAGGGASGLNRLALRLRGRDALSYVVGGDLDVPRAGDHATLSLRATSPPAAAAQAEQALREEVERLVRDGVSADEVAQAARVWTLERQEGLQSDGGLAAALLDHLDREITFQADQAQDDERLAAVTPELVLQALRRLLRPEAWVVMVSNGEVGSQP